MLAYAAGRPRIGERRPSPNAMLLIISAHVAAVALVMSAKMDLPRHIFDPPTTIVSVPIPPVPPPTTTTRPQAPRPVSSTNPLQVQTRAAARTTDEQLPIELGNAADSIPTTGETLGNPLPPLPRPVATSTPAQPMTPAADLKPPYPESKLLAGEEGVLTLRLTIDENGRVVGVDPIGRADPVFLAAARRHLMARWRYKPAMQGGHAVLSNLVVTLKFQLDG